MMNPIKNQPHVKSSSVLISGFLYPEHDIVGLKGAYEFRILHWKSNVLHGGFGVGFAIENVLGDEGLPVLDFEFTFKRGIRKNYFGLGAGIAWMSSKESKRTIYQSKISYNFYGKRVFFLANINPGIAKFRQPKYEFEQNEFSLIIEAGIGWMFE